MADSSLAAQIERFQSAVAAGAGGAALTPLLQYLQACDCKAWGDAAAALQVAGWPRAALALLAAAPQACAGDAHLALQGAAAARAAGDDQAAMAYARKAVALAPAAFAPAWLLAELLRAQGRTGAAAQVLAQLIHQIRLSASELCDALVFMGQCEAWALVLQAGEHAEAQGEHALCLQQQLAKACLVLGRFESARQRYRALVAATPEPHNRAAALGLALSHRYDDTQDTDLALLDGLLVAPAAADDAQAALHFARAKIADDLGDIAGAALQLRRANALAARAQPWDVTRWQHACRRALQPRLPRNPQASGELRPVFLLGMPRSGSTLLAEHLSRHAGIVTRGEMNFAAHLQQALDDGPHDADAVAASAHFYLTHLRRDDAPAQVYVDKNPLNFLYLDWISAALPQARIVLCTRQAAGVALSLWFQHFESPETGFSNRFDWIGEAMAGCRAIVDFWASRVPLLEVAYEDLVRDEATVLGRVLDFIGVSAAHLRSADTTAGHSITTASLWQARQPLYTRSVQRWRRYLPYVPELRAFVTSAD